MQGSADSLPAGPQELDMNVADSYGIDWDIEKCGRDVWQNFFDANGGTIDGIQADVKPVADESGDYELNIEGGQAFDYRLLTIIGATTKATGEQTAGGFGEGAKFLALSLLRDHGAKEVVYRSQDWQLEFYIDDMAEERVAHPTRGLFARVTKGLDEVEGSHITIKADKETVNTLAEARSFFRSAENPDFQDNLLQKTLPDGTETGIKFLGVAEAKPYYPSELNTGHLYVAGQRRHYSSSGDKPKEWATVKGISVWTTKDVAPGDRDRGALSSQTLRKQILMPLVAELTADDVTKFFVGIEPAYERKHSGGRTDLGVLGELIATKGAELDVKIEFDSKYVAVSPFTPYSIIESIEKAGYISCPDYFERVGMRSGREVLKSLHKHQRIEASPEQATRVELLQEALATLVESSSEHEELVAKPIWLYSKEQESNPFEGTYDEEFVWLSEEHLEKPFSIVMATYLHEIAHKFGTDQSAEFSYALTNTLAALIEAFAKNPKLAEQFLDFSKRWDEALAASKKA